MKHVFLLLTLLTASVAFAEEEPCETTTEVEKGKFEIDTKVPKDLKGAMITVVTKDGKKSTMPAEQFKVVPRKQQFIVNKIKQTDRVNCAPTEKLIYKKNRISLLGGQGPKTGLDTDSNATTVEAESRVGLVGGLQYQRLLTQRLSLGALIQTNKTLSVSVGIDF